MQKTKYSKPSKKKSNLKIKNRFKQKDIDQLIELMSGAKKPIFYTGGGVINSGPKASELLRELVSLTGFPITSTLQGLGAYPGDDNQFSWNARKCMELMKLIMQCMIVIYLSI